MNINFLIFPLYKEKYDKNQKLNNLLWIPIEEE